eukprot:m.12061 g.12061  ORF g.12061 m.12061 type:complete len:424 (-) comp3203_c1_seq1:96-1367(-)
MASTTRSGRLFARTFENGREGAVLFLHALYRSAMEVPVVVRRLAVVTLLYFLWRDFKWLAGASCDLPDWFRGIRAHYSCCEEGDSLECNLDACASMKVVLVESVGQYIFHPLSIFLVHCGKLKTLTWLTADVITGTHVVCAVVASLMQLSDKIRIRRLGALLFWFRSFLDSVDGVQARAQRSNEIDFATNARKSDGFLMDAIADGGGGVFYFVCLCIVMHRHHRRAAARHPSLGGASNLPASASSTALAGLSSTFMPLSGSPSTGNLHAGGGGLISVGPPEDSSAKPATSNTNFPEWIASRSEIYDLESRQQRNYLAATSRQLIFVQVSACFNVLIRSACWDEVMRIHGTYLEKRNMMPDDLPFMNRFVCWLWRISSAESFLLYLLVWTVMDFLWVPMEALHRYGWYQIILLGLLTYAVVPSV